MERRTPQDLARIAPFFDMGVNVVAITLHLVILSLSKSKPMELPTDPSDYANYTPPTAEDMLEYVSRTPIIVIMVISCLYILLSIWLHMAVKKRAVTQCRFWFAITFFMLLCHVSYMIVIGVTPQKPLRRALLLISEVIVVLNRIVVIVIVGRFLNTVVSKAGLFCDMICPLAVRRYSGEFHSNHPPPAYVPPHSQPPPLSKNPLSGISTIETTTFQQQDLENMENDFSHSYSNPPGAGGNYVPPPMPPTLSKVNNIEEYSLPQEIPPEGLKASRRRIATLKAVEPEPPSSVSDEVGESEKTNKTDKVKKVVDVKPVTQTLLEDHHNMKQRSINKNEFQELSVPGLVELWKEKQLKDSQDKRIDTELRKQELELEREKLELEKKRVELEGKLMVRRFELEKQERLAVLQTQEALIKLLTNLHQ